MSAMEEPVFREDSLKRIRSPEDLSDYLRVTNPAVWIVLAAVILLLVGFLIWSATASIDSLATGTAQVENGSMRILFDNEQIAESVQPGMTVKVGETEGRISGVGQNPDGTMFATASTTLMDGSYPASVTLRKTQVIRLLFN